MSESSPQPIMECVICLSAAKSPVVTQCGHLFCWSCIWQWIETFRDKTSTPTCPECKAGIPPDSLISLYSHVSGGERSNSTDQNHLDTSSEQGQGNEETINTNTNSSTEPVPEEIPNRPLNPRIEPVTTQHGIGMNFDPNLFRWDRGNTFMDNILRFVDRIWQSYEGAGERLNEAQQQKLFLYRLFIIVGLLAIFSLLFI